MPLTWAQFPDWGHTRLVGMRAPGLRLQLLLLLGGLLVLGFVPLQWALSTYTQVTLRRLDEAHASALGNTLGAYVREASLRLPARELVTSLQAGARDSGLVAAVIHSGAERIELGEASVLAALAEVDVRIGEAPRLLRA